jgi:hypothetical protein
LNLGGLTSKTSPKHHPKYPCQGLVHTGHPKYDMDAYVATLFLEVRLGTYAESWMKQKNARPTLNTSSANIFI